MKKDYILDNNFYFKKETCKEVRDVINKAYNLDLRVILDYGDTKTGKSWGETNDIRGAIGRSNGEIKIPLLIPTARSHGGGAILDNCIIKITVVGAEQPLYIHENYQENKETLKQNDKIKVLSNISRLKTSLFEIIKDNKGLEIINRNLTSIEKLVNKQQSF